MLRLGISRVKDWTGSAVDFVQLGLARHCQANGLASVSRVFPEAHVRLLDEIVERSEQERNQSENVGPSSRIFISVHYDQAAMIPIGPALRLLGSIDQRLPAAFFMAVCHNLGRWMSVYDVRDAEHHAQEQIEFLEEGELTESFYPKVRGVRPPCLKRLPSYTSAVRLINTVSPLLEDQRARKLLSHCLTMHEHGAEYKHAWPYHLRDQVPEIEDYLEHTDEPGPGALVVFDEDDLVEACFTEQMQYLGQDNPIGSSLMLCIDLEQNSDSLDRSVKASFERLGAMVQSLASASVLIEMIRGMSDEDLRQRGIKQELPTEPGAARVRGE